MKKKEFEKLKTSTNSTKIVAAIKFTLKKLPIISIIFTKLLYHNLLKKIIDYGFLIPNDDKTDAEHFADYFSEKEAEILFKLCKDNFKLMIDMSFYASLLDDEFIDDYDELINGWKIADTKLDNFINQVKDAHIKKTLEKTQ